MSVFCSGVTKMELGCQGGVSKSTAAFRGSCLEAHFTDGETEAGKLPSQPESQNGTARDKNKGIKGAPKRTSAPPQAEGPPPKLIQLVKWGGGS